MHMKSIQTNRKKNNKKQMHILSIARSTGANKDQIEHGEFCGKTGRHLLRAHIFLMSLLMVLCVVSYSIKVNEKRTFTAAADRSNSFYRAILTCSVAVHRNVKN